MLGRTSSMGTFVSLDALKNVVTTGGKLETVECDKLSSISFVELTSVGEVSMTDVWSCMILRRWGRRWRILIVRSMRQGTDITRLRISC